jgi:hypothetical protein
MIKTIAVKYLISFVKAHHNDAIFKKIFAEDIQQLGHNCWITHYEVKCA